MKEGIAKLSLLVSGIIVVILGTAVFLTMSASLYEMIRSFLERLSTVMLG